MTYTTIEIDFDVYKKLTLHRESENVSYNDVLREILALPQKPEPKSKVSNETSHWVSKGVRFPIGTEFRASYKGKLYTATVDKNGLVMNNQCHKSPSAAAVSITGNSVNGWNFWEARFPNQSSWQLINTLRKA